MIDPFTLNTERMTYRIRLTSVFLEYEGKKCTIVIVFGGEKPRFTALLRVLSRIAKTPSIYTISDRQYNFFFRDIPAQSENACKLPVVAREDTRRNRRVFEEIYFTGMIWMAEMPVQWEVERSWMVKASAVLLVKRMVLALVGLLGVVVAAVANLPPSQPWL